MPLVIVAFFSRHARFLDYGGGYGIFVRLMRDYGFDFYRQDRYTENLFAVGFDAEDQPGAIYELVTAFEVFEHLAQPLEEIEKMLAYSRNVLFSTQLLPISTPDLNTWWYYGLDHGQHIALYSRGSLQEIARHFGLNVYSCGSALHLFTEKKLPPAAFALIGRLGRRAPWLAKLAHRHSLLPADYTALTGRQPE
ncbi:MAG: class I SAM-dependent methyltransferase [Anaerolineales bacterium]